MISPKIIFYKKIIDKRGYFSEIFVNKKLKKNFVQENLVFNKKKNTFRGLHYQQKPFDQGKLITVLRGSIIDFVCEIKKKNNKFNIKKFKLSDKDSKWLWVPSNYAHGYLTCENNTLILYKVTNHYYPKYEKKINVFDENLFSVMDLNKSKIIVSNKDA